MTLSGYPDSDAGRDGRTIQRVIPESNGENRAGFMFFFDFMMEMIVFFF